MLAVGQTGPSAWGSFTGRGGQEAAGLAAVQGGANEVAADEYVCCQKPKCLKIKKKICYSRKDLKNRVKFVISRVRYKNVTSSL